MKNAQQARTLWDTAQEQEPRAETEQPTRTEVLLSQEIADLLAELAPYDVLYHPDAPCKHCGCPLDYSLKLEPHVRVCCRCLPGGHKYGFDRHERILALFPRKKEAEQWL